ncbi:MAG: hypothetical protein SVR08_09320 [Spirochaetota bacterium]|nr:hypothetical protein [Spirochaetota bacterium]
MRSKCIICFMFIFLLSIINIYNSKVIHNQLQAQTSETTKYNKKTKKSRSKKKRIKKKSVKKSSYKKKSKEYLVPRRKIEIEPYYNFIFAHKLYTNIKSKTGHGGGIKIRTQVWGNFGYLFNTSLNYIEIEKIPDNPDDEIDMLSIYTGGFYYSRYIYNADYRFNISYGGISAGNSVMTIFLPSIEYHTKLHQRVFFNCEIGYLIVNDWIVDDDYKENYTSFSLSLGISFLF